METEPIHPYEKMKLIAEALMFHPRDRKVTILGEEAKVEYTGDPDTLRSLSFQGYVAIQGHNPFCVRVFTPINRRFYVEYDPDKDSFRVSPAD